MKDIIIVLLLLGLLWGGYKGMTYLGSLAQTDTTESEIQEEALADNSEKRLNKSAIKELQKSPPEVKQKKAGKNSSLRKKRRNYQKTICAIERYRYRRTKSGLG